MLTVPTGITLRAQSEVEAAMAPFLQAGGKDAVAEVRRTCTCGAPAGAYGGASSAQRGRA